MRKLLFLYLLLLSSFLQADVVAKFKQIKNDPNALYAFLKEMPKGGELHYHLAGGAYPETMLALAAKEDYCLNPKTLSMFRMQGDCKHLKASELANYPQTYDQVIRAWSMKDFIAGQESGHDHFFATFYKFHQVVMFNDTSLLAEIMQRASNQHELYMEIMVMPDYLKSTTVRPIPNLKPGLEQVKKELLADPRFVQQINNTVLSADKLVHQVKQQLGCQRQPNQAVCQLTVKFQYYILREQNLASFFMQALHGFAAANQSKEIVAINLVQPEDGIISLRDYKQQMKIIHFLHQAYPDVHIALHAGELSPKAVTPENLRFHIRDAIVIGNAERIGHGVSIGYEDKSLATLKMMREKGIAVEVNLTSNEQILGINGRQHPLNFYLQEQVPVVLSTDDEGILRTDLTREYTKAVMQHHLSYPELKKLSRNVLTYSFLKGKSLWKNAANNELVAVCQDLKSPDCTAFAKKEERANLQRELELRFLEFENKYN